MNNRMWMGPVAGALLLFTASCGDNKAVETTATDTTASGDTAVVMNDNGAMASADPEAMYRMRSRRIADKMYTDMKMTDTTMKSKFANVYYNRSKRYGEMMTKYSADTTGQHAAMMEANMAADKEMGTVLTDPAMYKQYETSRGNYAEEKYMDEMPMSGDASMQSGGDMSGNASSMNSGDTEMATGAMEGDKSKVKIKGEDGSKLKMKDGDVKVKDANGEKTKMNGN